MTTNLIFDDLLNIEEGFYDVKQLSNIKHFGYNLHGWIEVYNEEDGKSFMWATHKHTHDVRHTAKDLTITYSGKIQCFFHIRRSPTIIWGYGIGSKDSYAKAVEFAEYLQSVFCKENQVQTSNVEHSGSKRKDIVVTNTDSNAKDKVSTATALCILGVIVLLVCFGAGILPNLK